MRLRLNAFIARAGICSRRAAETLIATKKITVNGRVVTALGTTVDSDTDTVTYAGKRIALSGVPVTIMLHKPVGVTATCKSQDGERTVIDIVHKSYRLYPIGRLDKDSSGLLLLTNDGDLALKLTHPRYEHEKEYVVTTLNKVTDEQLTTLRRGVMLDGARRTPYRVTCTATRELTIVLREGRNRQIRRMIVAAGNHVVSLMRVRVGALTLGSLGVGKFRDLTPAERTSLLNRPIA